MFCELLVHTSDLSSPAKVWDVSVKWSERVNKEFIAQNILEEARDEIPITPFFCNLNDPKVLAK